MRRRDLSKVLLAGAAGASVGAQPAMAQAACVPPCYPQTAAEIAAGVAVPNTSYPPANLLRYHAGGTDYSAALQAMFNVLCSPANATGGEQNIGVIPRGEWRIRQGARFDSAAASSRGVIIEAYGATLVHTGSGYAIDAVASGTSASFYAPTVGFYGLNVKGTASGAGAFRIVNVCEARFVDCRGVEYANGAAFTLRNEPLFCERNSFLGCVATSCKYGMRFEVAANALDSFARTFVSHFGGAGISEFWFDIPEAASVYDSIFQHIEGNFGSRAYFQISGDMGSSFIDGLLAERNDDGQSVSGQSIIRLGNYPTSLTKRRPHLRNIGFLAGFTGSGYIPTWADGAGVAIPGPEPLLLQGLNIEGSLSVGQGALSVSSGRIVNAEQGRYIAGKLPLPAPGTWYQVPSTAFGVGRLLASTALNDGPKFQFDVAKAGSFSPATIVKGVSTSASNGQSIECRWNASAPFNIELRLVGGVSADLHYSLQFMN